MSILSALLHRDHDVERPVCGVADGYVFGEPDDFPCRDTATRRVVFHCPRCGWRTRTVCDFHEQVLAGGTGACEVCAAAGDTVPVEFINSTDITEEAS